jgi:DNA-binding transcriptional MerR regulator
VRFPEEIRARGTLILHFLDPSRCVRVDDLRAQMDRAYTIRQFAAVAGVSVRALHHYDRVGLLSPERAESGYRLYRDADLEIIEQIVALKFIGIPLKQIKALLHRDRQTFLRALGAQRLSLSEKRKSIDAALDAIERAERSALQGAPIDATTLKRIIEVLTMQNDDAADKYQSLLDAKIERLKEMSVERRTELGRQWRELLADVEKSLGEDPAGPKAQELADRWLRLLRVFGKGAAIDSALMQASALRVRSTEWNQRLGNPAVWDFIGKAISVRENRP